MSVARYSTRAEEWGRRHGRMTYERGVECSVCRSPFDLILVDGRKFHCRRGHLGLDTFLVGAGWA